MGDHLPRAQVLQQKHHMKATCDIHLPRLAGGAEPPCLEQAAGTDWSIAALLSTVLRIVNNSCSSSKGQRRRRTCKAFMSRSLGHGNPTRLWQLGFQCMLEGGYQALTSQLQQHPAGGLSPSAPTIVSSVQFSCSVVSDSLWPHGLQHARPPCSSPTHIHWVGDAIQPSHPLLSPSPPAFNLSQHQGLFKWVTPLHQVAKVLWPFSKPHGLTVGEFFAGAS